MANPGNGSRQHARSLISSQQEHMMQFWQTLNIRKKLTYSILTLTFVLAVTAGLVSGLKLASAQTDALWTKGQSLCAVLAEAVTSSYLSDDLGTTTGASARALEFVKGDHEVSMAALVTASSVYGDLRKFAN